MKKIILLISLLITTQVFADAYIAVNKGDASLCEVIPAQAKKGHHYNKSVNPREISSDLWRSGKNGLGFFKLGKSEIQSQTVQLAFVDKYSTFWYYTKQNTKTKGPYFYDFIAPNNSGKKFVDIDLQLPCSCFLDVDKPQRCSSQLNRFQDKFGNWWQQTGSSTAKKIGNNISDKSNQAVDATKDWWNTTGSKQAAEVQHQRQIKPSSRCNQRLVEYHRQQASCRSWQQHQRQIKPSSRCNQRLVEYYRQQASCRSWRQNRRRFTQNLGRHQARLE